MHAEPNGEGHTGCECSFARIKFARGVLRLERAKQVTMHTPQRRRAASNDRCRACTRWLDPGSALACRAAQLLLSRPQTCSLLFPTSAMRPHVPCASSLMADFPICRRAATLGQVCTAALAGLGRDDADMPR